MTLEVEQLPLGAYQSNCYVVRRPDAAEAVVVDPGWPGRDRGASTRPLAGARCVAILVTHGDIDHVAGVAELAEATGAPVYMPAAERERSSARRLPAGGDRRRASGARRRGALEGDERLELAGDRVPDAARARSHRRAMSPSPPTGLSSRATSSSPARSAATTGRGRAGRRCSRSIRMLVERLPPETIVYPGHGPATTLERELATNPFLAELRAPRREDPGAARHAATSCPLTSRARLAVLGGARSTAGDYGYGLDRHAGLRGHRALRAHVRRRARTWSRRRCTRSRTGAAAR